MKFTKDFYTTKEAQEILGLRNSTAINGYCARGYLDCQKFGRVWQIKRDSLKKRYEKQRAIDKAIKRVEAKYK